MSLLSAIFSRNAKVLLEKGDRLKNGTVCFAVNRQRGEALFAPEEMYAGKSGFFAEPQNAIVDKANEQKIHGHDDWRRLEDPESGQLADAWDIVAPREMQGPKAEYFWMSSNIRFANYGPGSPFTDQYGLARSGGDNPRLWSDKVENERWLPITRDGSDCIALKDLSLKSRLKAARQNRIQA